MNPKKDSENTPVKGGTVADLGKARRDTHPSYSKVVFAGQQEEYFKLSVVKGISHCDF